MRVLIAFDKFKDSISAAAACRTAAGAIGSARPLWDLEECPLSDGGEGFTGILTRAAGGAESPVTVVGPRGAHVAASFGVISLDRIPLGARARLGLLAYAPGGTLAIIEMAAASGLALLEPELRDPLRASSIGTGQLIRAAAATRPSAILVGIGGSATHDLGLGALSALGIRCFGGAGEALDPLVPAEWPFLARMGGKIPDGLPPVYIACDVDNPLLGDRGALAVYGRQKGLRPDDAAAVEAATARVAAIVCRHFGKPDSLASIPGAGAAGGTAFGLIAAANATLLPGFDLVASWLDLDEKLEAADMVITGEGRFDDSSLSGKGPGAVVRRALALDKLVHVFAGEVALSDTIPGLFTHRITPTGMSLSAALAGAPRLLFDAVKAALVDG